MPNVFTEETAEILISLLSLVPASFYGLAIMAGNSGRRFLFAGILTQGAGILLRGATLGTLPVTEKHDTIALFAFCAAMIYWNISRSRQMKSFSILAPAVISFFSVVSFHYMPINTISPFLKSPWFYLHSLSFFVSYSFFCIGTCIGIECILDYRSECEQLQYTLILCGWVICTASLVFGSLWFYVAYGTYWLWTAKELWITIMWIFYSLYLHARYMKAFQGKPAAAIGAAGFLIALFAYFGVGTVIPSPPTQF